MTSNEIDSGFTPRQPEQRGITVLFAAVTVALITSVMVLSMGVATAAHYLP